MTRNIPLYLRNYFLYSHILIFFILDAKLSNNPDNTGGEKYVRSVLCVHLVAPGKKEMNFPLYLIFMDKGNIHFYYYFFLCPQLFRYI